MAKWYEFLFPILGTAYKNIQAARKAKQTGDYSEFGSDSPDPNDPSTQLNGMEVITNGATNAARQVKSGLEDAWNDYTGQTQIGQQLQANKELALYQTQMQEELYNKYSSPAAMMKQYEAAGLNPNLIYGSAGSGQSNVPTYNAPSAPMNLSYSDKFNKALALMSNVLSVKNLVYSTVANREAAQQSWLKTLQENQRLNTMFRNNLLESKILGHAFRNFLTGKRYSFGSYVSTEPYALDYYAEAIRNERINKAMQPGLYNQWEYGKYHSPLFGDLLEPVVLGQGIKPNSYWNNFNMQYAGQQRQYDYQWDQDYKTMLKGAGVAAPIIQTLLRILGGKK